jgi:hypothetical protein
LSWHWVPLLLRRAPAEIQEDRDARVSELLREALLERSSSLTFHSRDSLSVTTSRSRIFEPQVSDKRRLGRVSSIATRPSEAAGEQDAAPNNPQQRLNGRRSRGKASSDYKERRARLRAR